MIYNIWTGHRIKKSEREYSTTCSGVSEPYSLTVMQCFAKNLSSPQKARVHPHGLASETDSRFSPTTPLSGWESTTRPSRKENKNKLKDDTTATSFVHYYRMEFKLQFVPSSVSDFVAAESESARCSSTKEKNKVQQDNHVHDSNNNKLRSMMITMESKNIMMIISFGYVLLLRNHQCRWYPLLLLLVAVGI